MNARYVIPADYGCLALLDLERYISYVGEDEAINGIKSHLIVESKKGSIVAWGCPYGNWNIDVLVGTSSGQAQVRSYTGFLKTGGNLFLTDYESLMTVAQFEDDKLPLPGLEKNVIHVEPGIYSCKVIQCYDPSLSDEVGMNDQVAHYILELNKADALGEDVDVPWTEIP